MQNCVISEKNEILATFKNIFKEGQYQQACKKYYNLRRNRKKLQFLTKIKQLLLQGARL